MFSSGIVQILLAHAFLPQSTGMYMINQKHDLLALLTYFAFTWSFLKGKKAHLQKCILAQMLCTNTMYIRLLDYTSKKNQKLVNATL